MDSAEEMSAAVAFIRRVKQRFPNYQPFAAALMGFKAGKTDAETALSNVYAFLDAHRDLAAEFNHFRLQFNPPESPKAADCLECHHARIRPAKESPDRSRAPTSAGNDGFKNTRKRKAAEDLEGHHARVRDAKEFVDRIREFAGDDVYASFLRAVAGFNGRRDVKELDREVDAMFQKSQNPELYVSFTWFTADSWPDPDEDTAGATAGGWELVKRKRKARKSAPKPDTTLDDCEDELFESDMILHALEDTQRVTIKLLASPLTTDEKEVEECYSAVNLRCIGRTLGEAAAGRMIESLRMNRVTGLEELTRILKERIQETRLQRQEIKQRCDHTITTFCNNNPRQ
ncbi:unnamed protein product [Cuscuta epithymum]|uniref:Histone deacetylase interacting domain-containing protein n=1 Tax=Cuscuta epithymum TaxID=186058 RepID=A0AAV0FY38_9ASTE|nr:unnamed protein product [Cuscuta epithymum]